MGAWGVGTFDNDDAGDWLYDLEETNDLSLIDQSLTLEDDYIEAPDGCNALAAAEIIAALMGKTRKNLPENAAKWVNDNKEHPANQLKEKAIKAIGKVLSENSELIELWEEGSDFDGWKKDVNEIKKLLR